MKKLLFPLCCGVIVEQIKQKDYLDCLKNYSGEVLLVGVNYDKEKRHTCRIERAVILGSHFENKHGTKQPALPSSPTSKN